MPKTALVVLLCLFSFPAHAVPCWQVRMYVTAYGERAAMNWARSHGYSERQINEAKRCLFQSERS
jgi:hypothetical protein